MPRGKKNNRRKSVSVVTTVSRNTNTPKKKTPQRASTVNCCLSQCAAKYLRAVENPFAGAPACVPTSINRPSEKETYTARFLMVTGTQGLGFVQVNPWACLWSDANSLVAGSPMSAILSTDATFAGVSAPAYTTAGAVPVGTTATFSAAATNYRQVQQRVVGCGLRIKNVTPIMSRGGYGVIAESYTHADTVTNTYSQIQENPLADAIDADGKWTSVVWHPEEMDEYDFISGAGLGINSNRANQYSNYNLVAAVFAPPTIPQTYQCEVYVNSEIIGSLAKGASPSQSDSHGMDAIQNATSTVASRKPIVGDRDGWYQSQLWKAAVEGGRLVGTMAVKAAVNYVGNRQQTSALRIMNSRPYEGPLIEELD